MKKNWKSEPYYYYDYIVGNVKHGEEFLKNDKTESCLVEIVSMKCAS